jgi:hypothetical protein
MEAAGPLYERAPTHDADGRPVSDFMLLIPGLRDLPRDDFTAKTHTIQTVLASFAEVVFADLNVRLNLLWVSVRARPGVILDIAACMKFHVPEVLIVGHK